jgi:hypothetical protein
LKINRQPLAELPDEFVQHDREYWTDYIRPIIGAWLSVETVLPEVVAFVDRIYVARNLSGFRGDLLYIQNEIAQRSFSKLRSSTGGLYAWRPQNIQSPMEKERILKEADFAFRQSFVLCPTSPEAVFRYITLLVGQKRLDDAILLAEAAVRLEERPKPAHETSSHIQEDGSHKPLVPSGSNPPRLLTQLGSLLEQLKRMKTRQ